MSKLPYAKSFREMVAYKKARLLAKAIYQATMSFPEDEKYALVDQIRRSSRSIGAQIAEAWGKRPYEKHFVYKLTDADGEQCEEIGKMLGRMMSESKEFCGDIGHKIGDAETNYSVFPVDL